MKRIAPILLILLALCAVSWGVPKLLYTYSFAGQTYHRFKMDNGSSIEISGVLGEKAEVASAKAVQVTSIVIQEPKPEVVLDSFTDQQLATVLIDRKALTLEKGVYVLKSELGIGIAP